MTRPLNRGLLVAIEGIDGAGKTTQVEMVRAELASRGFDVVTSKEPTNGPWGSMIRKSAQTGRLPPEEELAAFIADRREHVSQLIAPSIAARKIVIVDRYYYSTIAYQGLHGRDPEEIRELNESFAPRPDVLLVLDLDPELALQRIDKRGDEANHFERVHLLEASREIFWRYVKSEPTFSSDGRRCCSYKIDASLAPEEMKNKIVSAIMIAATEAIVADDSLSLLQKLEATHRLCGGSGNLR